MAKADAHNQPGKYAEGAEFAEKALAIRIRLLGEENRQSVLSASWTGSLWKNANQYKKACPYLEQALAIRKKVLGDDHPDTATSLHNLGSLLNRQGDYAAARPYFEEALAIRKKVLGGNHADTATSLNDLGVLLERLGDYSTARTYNEQALAISRRSLDIAAAAQSERQQLLMGTSLRYRFYNFLSLPVETDAITAAAYAHALAWKRSVLARQQQLRLERQNP
jgi:tetratricopeptide (TPR) repeat protein